MLGYLPCEGFSEPFGARELRRVIEQRVESAIAGKILRGEVRAGHAVVIDVQDGELAFGFGGRETM